jgi:hypothetical protein
MYSDRQFPRFEGKAWVCKEVRREGDVVTVISVFTFQAGVGIYKT